MEFTFRAFAEDSPGKVWQQEFNARWPAYRDWFMRFGERERPTYLESIRALKRHMPQIIPVYEQMVDLAGGGDRAARDRGFELGRPRCRGRAGTRIPAGGPFRRDRQ